MLNKLPPLAGPVDASGEPERKRVSDVLTKHWIVELRCNHDLKTDQAFCACATWKGPELLSVGSAVRAWADHVAEELAAAAVPSPPAQDWKPQMHHRIPHTFRSGCGVSAKGGIHWTTDMAYVTCPECIALQSPSPSTQEELPAEKFRRERRGIALTALEHLLMVAIEPFVGDRSSEQDLNDAYRQVSACIEDFEHEANDAERKALPPSSPVADSPTLRRLIEEWRQHSADTRSQLSKPFRNALNICADELDTALSAPSPSAGANKEKS